MKLSIFRRVALLVAALGCALSAMALDLDVKTIKGEKFYYYKVKKNETVYGISKKLGISREDIVRYNTFAEDGVKKGDTLFFPYDDFNPAEAPADTVAVVEEVVEEAVPAKQPSIVLMLPFGLDNAEQSRRNKLALDFYKGFLLAADTLASRPGEVTVHAIDTDVSDTALQAALAGDDVVNAAVIVAPDNESSYRTIAEAGRANGNYVLNVFIMADTLYASNPRVLQANIPHRDMYRLAVDAFQQDFEGFTPVILKNRSGRNEKESFVNYFMQRCAEKGVVPVEIEYDNNLVSADLEVLLPGQKYVFLPSSGSLAEFNKFAYVVKSYRDRLAAGAVDDSGAAVTAGEAAVFGYPDWTAFRGDALDTLHKLEVTIYSRFFDNFNGFDNRTLQSAFRRWYGQSMIESIPSQAVLGYDTGCFLIKNLRANNGVFDPLAPRVYNGLQSTFDFDKSQEGFFNSALYIIKYQPDGSMSARVI